jgi:hypothetical protein
MSNHRMKRQRSFLAVTLVACAVSLGLISMTGCSGSASLAKGYVTILPGPTQVGTGGSLQIFAEATPSQVTWAITSETGCSGTGCGTLSSQTGTSVTYLGPQSISGTNVTFTLTATSTANPGISASATYTIFPVSVQITGPTSSTVQPVTSAGFTAVVNGDPTGEGVTWSLSGANCSGIGILFSNCGTLSHSTSNSVTYTAPAAPMPETIMLTATSVAFPGTNAVYAIAVPKLTVYSYSPTTLPPAIIGQPYRASVLVTGNTPPYMFAVSNLPSWATITPAPPASGTSFTISGTPPSGSQGATFVQVTTTDSAKPVDSGSEDFTLSVYPAAATGDNLLNGTYAFYAAGWLDGTLGDPGTAYQGITYIGSFHADGQGNITGGEVDTNNFQTGLASFTNLSGTYDIQYGQSSSTQTGYITLLPPGNNRPITLAVSLRGIAHPVSPVTAGTDIATAGDFIEFDDTTGDGATVTVNSSGQRMSGTLALQTDGTTILSPGTAPKASVLNLTSTPFNGGFAFGMLGNTPQSTTFDTLSANCFNTAPPSCGPISLAGAFTVNSTGTITGGEEDVMIASNYYAATAGSLTGSFANGGATDAFGRMTASIVNMNAGTTGIFSGWPSSYIAYAVDSQHFYIMSSNSYQTFSTLIGTATYQQPTVASLPINVAEPIALLSSVVSTQYFTGGTGPNGKVRSQVQVFSATLGAAGCTSTQYGLQGPQYQNLSGTVTTATVGSIGNYCNTLGANGRLLPASNSTGEAEPILYLTDTNTGYGTQWNQGSGPGLWFVYPRTSTTLNAGTYSDSMVSPTSIQSPLEAGVVIVPAGGVPGGSKAVAVTGTIFSQFSAPNEEYSSSGNILYTGPITGTLTNNGSSTVNGVVYNGILLKNAINLLPANTFQACASGYGFVISSTSFMCIDTIDQFATPHLFQQ